MSQPRRIAFSLAMLVGAIDPARAQNPAPSAGQDDEVIQLSEFSVRGEPDRGYVASETVTGTRVRTQIMDLPYTVSVATSEFFEEFAMFEIGDNLTQIGSFTGLDIGGGFSLRGFSATSQLRDGFYRLGRYGSSNIDRLEIIKGSNAAIYGRASPGGMINFISKQPRTRPSVKLTLNAGSYDTERAVLEATGPLAVSRWGKTYYILTLSTYQRSFDQEYSRFHNQEYYLALRHVFDNDTTLNLSAEYFLQIRHSPTAAAPLVVDQKGTSSTADDVAIGYATPLARINAYGPHSELNRGNTSITATFERKLSEMWTTRVAANYFRARRWDFNQNTGWGTINLNPPSGAAPTTGRGATPNKGYIMEDGGGFQADVLVHNWFARHSIENRSLVTLDFNDYYRWDPTWNYSSATDPDLVAWNTARVVTLGPDLSPIGPVPYFPNWLQWGKEVINRLTRRRTTVLGGLAREQLAFFNGRLLTFAGVRFDAVRFQERDWTTTVGSAATAGTFRSFPGYENYNQGDMIRKTITQTKPNFGFNYKLTNQVRVFGSYSESYFVNQTDNPIVFADPTYKPETGSGYDYGVKTSLLGDRLMLTVSGFYYKRNNVSVSDTFESPPGSGNYVTQNRRDGDQLVRGYEIEGNWRVTDELSALLNWGHVYSIYTNFGSGRPLSVGRRVNSIVPENGGVALRYAPKKGFLRGFSANVGWTYVASTPSENPDAGDTYTVVNGVPVLQRTTYQWRLRTPSYGLWNAGARYTFRTRRIEHTLGLNVNNAFDVRYLKNNRQAGDERAVFGTYSIEFR